MVGRVVGIPKGLGKILLDTEPDLLCEEIERLVGSWKVSGRMLVALFGTEAEPLLDVAEEVLMGLVVISAGRLIKLRGRLGNI